MAKILFREITRRKVIAAVKNKAFNEVAVSDNSKRLKLLEVS